jgi:transcriptional antiterminator NusG
MTAATNDIVKKWYVVRAISGKEKKVKQYIELEIGRLGMNDYVSQVLIPTEKIYQIKNTAHRRWHHCSVQQTI